MRRRIVVLSSAIAVIATSLWVIYNYPKEVSTISDGHDNVTISTLLGQTRHYNDFFLKENLFALDALTYPDEIERIYKENVTSWHIPKKIERDNLAVNSKQTALTMLTWIFREYVSGNKTYHIPIVYHKGSIPPQVKAFDKNYKELPYIGMRTLEASLKKGGINEAGRLYGIIESSSLIPFQSQSINQGLIADQIPQNGVYQDINYHIYWALPRLLGFFTNSDKNGFRYPLSSLDNHLYITNLNRFVFSKDSFKNIFKGVKDDERFLEFKGVSVNSTLDNYNFNPKAKNVHLLVNLDKKGEVSLKLRNTILSDSDFVNYGFYSEVELSLLRDLGYNIYPREFYGSSIYTSGNLNDLQKILITSGYFSWNESSKIYNRDEVSFVPLSVGTHIYGNYNEVRQQSAIASMGYGSVGVRIDGVGNSLILPKKGVIVENGVGATGIAVTYGKNNILDLKGVITANNDLGVGLRFDFGDNFKSNYLEYQGSFIRARSLDFSSGLLTKEKAQECKLSDDIKGPLVKRVNLSGQVIGNKAAILIGDTAWVSEINFLEHASIKGDIISEYKPFVDENWIYVQPKDSENKLISARFQLMPQVNFLSGIKIGNSSFFELLKTKLNFGGKSDGGESLVNNMGFYSGDPRAYVDVSGDIKGSQFDINVLGGVALVDGEIDVNSVTVSDSSFHVNAPESGVIRMEKLYLDSGASLNISNGRANNVIVNKSAFISNSSVIKVDTDELGTILDNIYLEGNNVIASKRIRIEPCVSYAQIKHFNADPKALLSYVNRFVVNASVKFARYGISVQFPEHIWYKSGFMGRKLKCTGRGCRVGSFIGNNQKLVDVSSLPPWRIALSLIGSLMLILSMYFWAKKHKGEKGKAQEL